MERKLNGSSRKNKRKRRKVHPVVFTTDPEKKCLTLNNSIASFKHCIGFCRKHKCYVTKKQFRYCSVCSAMIKNEKNPFWKEREKRKQLKKLKKMLWKQKVDAAMGNG